MTGTGRFASRCRFIVSAPFLAFALHAGALRDTHSAPDVCSWLTPAELTQTLGEHFGPPEQSVRNPIIKGHESGTRCDYQSQNESSVEVVLVGYIEPSPSEAKATYEKVIEYSDQLSKPTGIGDDAYVDQKGAIHVLKGNVLYLINIVGLYSPKKAKQLTDLAALVATRV